MILTIYKTGKKVMCDVPGRGEVNLFELAVGLGLMTQEQIVETLGTEKPEIEVQGELKKDELEVVQKMREWFDRKYS